MHSSVSRRIKRLEQQAGITAEPPPIVIIFLEDAAEHQGQKWRRKPDESENGFQNRVMDDIEALGHKGRFLNLCFTDKPINPPTRIAEQIGFQE